MVSALLCLAVLVGIQYGAGQIFFGGEALVLVLYVQLALIAIAVGQSNARDPDWPLTLAFALLFAALGSAYIALAQALWVWPDSGWMLSLSGYRRAGANLGQPNLLGTLLVMGAASLLYLAQRLNIARSIVSLLFLLLIVGIGVTESRTGLLSSLALAAWWVARRSVFPSMFRWLRVVVCIVVLVSWTWIWPDVLVSFHEVVAVSAEVVPRTAIGSRWVVWPQLWEAVWMRPWLGWGLRGTSTALSSVLDGSSLSEPFTYAHNVVLDMAIGMGLPLTAIALAALSIWAWARIRRAHSTEGWFAVALLVPFVVHSMLEYPFAYAYLLVPGMLAVGMLDHLGTKEPRRKISKNFVACFLVVFGSLLAGVTLEYKEIEEDFTVARFEALNVGKTAAEYKRPDIVLLTQMRALLEAMRATPQPNMPLETLELLRATASRFPWEPVQNCYALSAALNGNLAEAHRQLNVMRAMRGRVRYEAIRVQWDDLARKKYPQLREFAWP
jgi:hypothetical protein